MPTTDEYLDDIAWTAQPTPQSEGGRVLTLKLSLYKPTEPGRLPHTGLSAKGCTGLAMDSDAHLLSSIERVIELVRSRM